MEFNNLRNKQEYITYCLERTPDINHIDELVPADIYMACKKLGLPCSNLVSIIYNNGVVSYENIIAKATVIYKSTQIRKY